MNLWRLSVSRHAADLNGGYGLVNDGRWNVKGLACIYAATGAALPVLEKRVHVADPSLLPPLMMVTYQMPDTISRHTVPLSSLPTDWIARQDITQEIGDKFLRDNTAALLFMPSAIVPLDGIPDSNVLINPAHPDSKAITIARNALFSLDTRLFR